MLGSIDFAKDFLAVETDPWWLLLSFIGFLAEILSSTIYFFLALRTFSMGVIENALASLWPKNDCWYEVIAAEATPCAESYKLIGALTPDGVADACY